MAGDNFEGQSELDGAGPPRSAKEFGLSFKSTEKSRKGFSKVSDNLDILYI